MSGRSSRERDAGRAHGEKKAWLCHQC
jgi:hypothetical protein